MGLLSSKLRSGEGGRITYWCQGCNDTHTILAVPGRWSFDGNAEAPTFAPSVLARSGHYAEGFVAGSGCWCTYNAKAAAKGEKPSGFDCRRCHTFIRGGIVEFLSDCSHALRGFHPLPDLPDHLRDA